jgi:hypothetical protein
MRLCFVRGVLVPVWLQIILRGKEQVPSSHNSPCIHQNICYAVVKKIKRVIIKASKKLITISPSSLGTEALRDDASFDAGIQTIV